MICPNCGAQIEISAEARFVTDTQFRGLVNIMINALQSDNFTASEIREAAIFAAQFVEERRNKPFIYPYGEQKRRP